MPSPFSFAGLDLLATSVLLLDDQLIIQHANPAAENLFGLNRKALPQIPLCQLFSGSDTFNKTLQTAIASRMSYNEHELSLLGLNHMLLQVGCTITPVDLDNLAVLLEFRQLDQQLRVVREERFREQQEFNHELIRNLAHEIRNPLGGIRGAAQLLEMELGKGNFSEYTSVIIDESIRLQSLLDRLLMPHKLPKFTALNIHEIMERVKNLILAESKHGLIIKRDYDVSLPEMVGDKEQLMQAILNIARNAAQALGDEGEIILRTRVTRQITIAKVRYRHAVNISVIDNGPGIPEKIRDKIFYPLVTGREGGSGLGLSLAQRYIHHHQGSIEFTSCPKQTCFSVLLPIIEDHHLQ